jgi:hypothetical protein
MGLPISYEVDVVVAGGGSAGVAAAVGAARLGQRVLMIEKYGFSGGMATAGMCGAICGLFSSSKSKTPVQLVNGFAGEFYNHMKSRNGVSKPVKFGYTAAPVHDPHVWIELADDLLTEAGVNILYHSYCVDVIKDGNYVEGVIVENKNGRHLVRAKQFIDATGDGDLAVWAGAPYVFGRNGTVQYATMAFRMNHVDVYEALSHSVDQIEEWANEAESDGYVLPRKRLFFLPSPRPGEIVCNVTKVAKANGDLIDATKAEDLTEGEILGRKQVRMYERFFRNYVPGFENAILNDVATQLGIRQSRTIVGRGILTNQDVYNCKKSSSSVAKSAWCIEAHGEDGVFLHFLDEDYYEIPYEALLPKNLENVITAGRTISAEHEALASARVTAQCFLTGYAAGTAAALAVRDGMAPYNIDVSELQNLINYE